MPVLRIVAVLAIVSLLVSASNAEEPSRCFGRTSDGSLQNGWKLPGSGANFSAYSSIGRMFGRTYVHSTVYSVVLDAYKALEISAPNSHFVYGETGKRNGGEFSPHKTHQNGLSVDFMVPLVDRAGRSVPMATSVLNKWGYDHEVDGRGRLGDLQLDADAMAEHLYHLHVAAKKHGVDIWRVIFDPDLQSLLHKTARWAYLKENVKFLQTRSWVRHDEHYHVDFEISCGPAA